jgi:hypothetical protein
VIEFAANAFAQRDRALAARLEAEIREAAGEEARAVCRIESEGADPAAPDRVRIVLVKDEAVLEWTVALPLAPGDVTRAARRALHGRRGAGERRRAGRARLDRRRG